MESFDMVAPVPRAFFVVLVAVRQSFNLPVEGAFLILGVDALARTSVTVTGNCLASVVVARWEKEFDESKALKNFDTPAATDGVKKVDNSQGKV